jgi:hypothetical protein
MKKYSKASVVSVFAVLLPIVVQLGIMNNFPKTDVNEYFKWMLLAQSFFVALPTILWTNSVGMSDISSRKSLFSVIVGVYLILLIFSAFFYESFVRYIVLLTILKGLYIFLGSYESLTAGPDSVLNTEIQLMLLPITFIFCDTLFVFVSLNLIILIFLAILKIFRLRESFGLWDKSIFENAIKFTPEMGVRYLFNAVEKFIFVGISDFPFAKYSLVMKGLKPLSSLAGSSNYWLMNFAASSVPNRKQELEKTSTYLVFSITFLTLFIFLSVKFIDFSFLSIGYFRAVLEVKNIIALACLGLLPSAIFSIYLKFLQANRDWGLRIKLFLVQGVVYLSGLYILDTMQVGDPLAFVLVWQMVVSIGLFFYVIHSLRKWWFSTALISLCVLYFYLFIWS